MTKKEYMERLREKLEQFNRELQEEILEDYESHFAEAQAEGKSEEEIIAELGDIEDMIQEFSEEDYKQEMIPVSAERKAPGEGICSGACNEIRVDAMLADVTLRRSKDGNVHVYYEGGERASQYYRFYQYEEDSVLYVGVKRVRESEDGKRFFAFGRMISTSNFGGRREELSLTLEIPQKLNRVFARTESGDMEADGLCVKELELESGSGSMRLGRIEAERLIAHTASGDIELDSAAAEKLTAHTASGDIALNNAAVGKLTIRTASGDVSLGKIKAEVMSTQGASGDLEMDDVNAERFTVETGSGDITVGRLCGREATAVVGSGCIEVYGDVESYRVTAGSGDLTLKTSGRAREINLTAGSGDVELDMAAVPGAAMDVYSRSGDVEISGALNYSSEGARFTGCFGDGSCRVKIQTGSGDVQVMCAQGR